MSNAEGDEPKRGIEPGDTSRPTAPGDTSRPTAPDDTARPIAPEDTVRRAPGPNADYVRALFRHLQRYDWPGAPRFLGLDDAGFEVFADYPGRVASLPYQPPGVWSDASLARVARLLRQLHDLTVGTDLAGDTEVACHNDAAPANTVYRDTPDGLRPHGFVNWDLAAPGRRVHDLAYACWRFCDLGPARSDPAGPARLMRLMCDSYELGRRDRAELVDTVLWWQQRVLDEADARGTRAGPIKAVAASLEWVREYGDILDAVVTARHPPPGKFPPQPPPGPS